MIKKTLLKTTSLLTLAMTISAFSPSLANAAWKQNSTGWWYTEGNSWATGWRQIGRTWYFFDANGYMKTGWLKNNGSWYFFDNSGAMKTGWVKDGGYWYYMNNSGAMMTGWVQDGGAWYYMNAYGSMMTGWVQDNGSWYYMNQSGAMMTGWVQDGADWYFLGQDGSMKSNTWIYDNNNYGYYLVGSNGAMATGFYKHLDGYTYYFYEDGFLGTNDIVDGYFIDENGVVGDKLDHVCDLKELQEIIIKEDGEFIKDFEARNDIDTSDIAAGAVYRTSYLLNGYSNINDEVVYFLVLYNPYDNDTFESYAYMVGAKSGKVYRTYSSGGHDIYEMKDNEIVNTYKYDTNSVKPANF